MRAAAASPLALALALGAARRGHARARGPRGDLVELMDNLVRQGDETPQSAIDSINELSDKDVADSPLLRRTAITSIGIIEARNGQNAEALAAGRRADGAGPGRPAGRGRRPPGARRDRGQRRPRRGLVPAGARRAGDLRRALRAPAAKQHADCDYREWWRALDLAQRGAADQGNTVVASAYAQTMVDVARRAGDRPREAISLGISALQAEANADPVARQPPHRAGAAHRARRRLAVGAGARRGARPACCTSSASSPRPCSATTKPRCWWPTPPGSSARPCCCAPT